MRYQVRLERRAERQLLALPDSALRRVDAALRGLAQDPRPTGVRKLRGKQTQGWRLRIGEYRALYTVDDVGRVVTVYRIDLRDKAYR